MGRFEDQLWADLTERHGAALAVAERPAAHRGRPMALTAGALGAAGLATAVAVTLTATTGSPAYAVTKNPNGTVTVTIHQIEGVSGANAELVKLGVRARAVAFSPGCTAKIPYVSTRVFGGGAVQPSPPDGFTIEPNLIPLNDTLLLVATQISGDRTAMAAMVVSGPAPVCYGGPHFRVRGGPGGASGSRSPSADTGPAPPHPVSPAPTR
jgi:hypothetical protein